MVGYREPATAYPESPLEKTWRWVQRNRLIVLIVLAYTLTRVLVYFFSP